MVLAVLEPAHEGRRHQRGEGHPFGRDGPQGPLGRWRGQHDHPAAGQDRADDARTGHGVTVGEGKHGQVDRVLVHAAQHRRAGGHVGVVVVRARDDLRSTGRAAGQQVERHRGGTRRLGRRQGSPVRRGAESVDIHVGRRDGAASHHDDDRTPQLGGDLRRHPLMVEIGRLTGDDQRAGAGTLHQGEDLDFPVGRKRHQWDDPGTETGEQQDDELPAVRQLQDEAVAGFQPEGTESRGSGVDPAEELGEGQPGAVLDQAGRLGGSVDPGLQVLADGPAGPVAALAVGHGWLGRPPGRLGGKVRPDQRIQLLAEGSARCLPEPETDSSLGTALTSALLPQCRRDARADPSARGEMSRIAAAADDGSRGPAEGLPPCRIPLPHLVRDT